MCFDSRLLFVEHILRLNRRSPLIIEMIGVFGQR